MWARMPITALVGDFDFEGVSRSYAYIYGTALGLCLTSSRGVHFE